MALALPYAAESIKKGPNMGPLSFACQHAPTAIDWQSCAAA
ncbi:hypothetical protein AKI40_pA010 (plasmid) [Enterobacter sp. FY-07]|nr:hypothetical protein AKI40_pA010 [Enterobacter sp. FY-07]